MRRTKAQLQKEEPSLRTVPTFFTAHTFCASRDSRFSYVPTSTAIFLSGLKLCGENRT